MRDLESALNKEQLVEQRFFSLLYNSAAAHDVLTLSNWGLGMNNKIYTKDDRFSVIHNSEDPKLKEASKVISIA